jgi:hypothetical protein
MWDRRVLKAKSLAIFGSPPLAARKRALEQAYPMLFGDPPLSARKRALAKLGLGPIPPSPGDEQPNLAVAIATAAPVCDRAINPMIEAVEATRTDCAEGVVVEPVAGPMFGPTQRAMAEPNEPSECPVIEPVRDAANESVEAALPAFDDKHKKQPQPRSRPLRGPAAEFLRELRDDGRIRENMRPGERYNTFEKAWPKNKQRPERDTVRRAWKELLESEHIAARLESPLTPPKK